MKVSKKAIIDCCKVNDKDNINQCMRKTDGKFFSLPRKFSKKRCLKGPINGFTMRSSCTPFLKCKRKSKSVKNKVNKINKINKVKKINKINSVNLNGIKFLYNSNNEIIVSYEREKHKIDEIINKIKNAGMDIYDISTDEGNLEDVFIDLTKS